MSQLYMQVLTRLALSFCLLCLKANVLLSSFITGTQSTFLRFYSNWFCFRPNQALKQSKPDSSHPTLKLHIAVNNFPLKIIAIFHVCKFSKNNPLCFSTNLNLLIHVKKTLCQNLSLKNRTYHLCLFYNTKMYLADRIQFFLERHKKYGFIFYLDLTLLSIVKTKDNSKFLWPSQTT